MQIQLEQEEFDFPKINNNFNKVVAYLKQYSSKIDRQQLKFKRQQQLQQKQQEYAAYLNKKIERVEIDHHKKIESLKQDLNKVDQRVQETNAQLLLLQNVKQSRSNSHIQDNKSNPAPQLLVKHVQAQTNINVNAHQSNPNNQDNKIEIMNNQTKNSNKEQIKPEQRKKDQIQSKRQIPSPSPKKGSPQLQKIMLQISKIYTSMLCQQQRLNTMSRREQTLKFEKEVIKKLKLFDQKFEIARTQYLSLANDIRYEMKNLKEQQQQANMRIKKQVKKQCKQITNQKLSNTKSSINYQLKNMIYVENKKQMKELLNQFHTLQQSIQQKFLITKQDIDKLKKNSLQKIQTKIQHVHQEKVVFIEKQPEKKIQEVQPQEVNIFHQLPHQRSFDIQYLDFKHKMHGNLYKMKRQMQQFFNLYNPSNQQTNNKILLLNQRISSMFKSFSEQIKLLKEKFKTSNQNEDKTSTSMQGIAIIKSKFGCLSCEKQYVFGTKKNSNENFLLPVNSLKVRKLKELPQLKRQALKKNVSFF